MENLKKSSKSCVFRVKPTSLDHDRPAADLLVSNQFIDKSEALYQILKDCYDDIKNDFDSIPLLIVFPRRFAKTTLLGFTDAIFNASPSISEYYENERIKKKIVALREGRLLLNFGVRPAIFLDMINVSNDADLDDRVEAAFKNSRSW